LSSAAGFRPANDAKAKSFDFQSQQLNIKYIPFFPEERIFAAAGHPGPLSAARGGPGATFVFKLNNGMK
jgi:hypothetical protein